MRRTNSGKAVANLGVAVNNRRRGQDGNYVDDTVFVDVDVWEKTAEFCNDYLRKGGKVLVEGRLKMDSWEDKTTGQNRSKLGIIGDRVQNLTPKTNDGGQKPDLPPAFPSGQAQPAQTPPPPFPSGDQTPRADCGYEDEGVDAIPFN
jgi:single-strand DNA-binding protein